MKKFSKVLAIILVFVMAVSCTACAPTVEFFTIGTAGTAGSLYPMGVAMAETISNHVPGYSVTGEATAASIENLRNLHEGELGWGISQNEITGFAYNGEGSYEGNAYTDLRALYSTIDNFIQVFALASSDNINSIEDLKGKTIGVGAAGSGGEMSARALLNSYGITYDDVNEQFMPESEAVSALKDGKIDAFIATHPIKSAAMVDLTTSAEAKMISIENEDFYDKYPAYSKYTVVAGTYNGINEDVIIPKSRITMVTSTTAGFTDDEVYEMVKAIWDNREEWSTSSNTVKTQVTLERALDDIVIPLHPGAVRYYEEIGMTVPEHLKG